MTVICMHAVGWKREARSNSQHKIVTTKTMAMITSPKAEPSFILVAFAWWSMRKSAQWQKERAGRMLVHNTRIRIKMMKYKVLKLNERQQNWRSLFRVLAVQRLSPCIKFEKYKSRKKQRQLTGHKTHQQHKLIVMSDASGNRNKREKKKQPSN